jgi:uncharacterized protein (DUF433 family)
VYTSRVTTNGVLRGVYNAERASALAGVPASTVYEWARKEVVLPSVSSERIKLWSWTDLIALRAVYWLRHPANDSRRATSMSRVTSLLGVLRAEVGPVGEALTEDRLRLWVDAKGSPHFDSGSGLLVMRRGGPQAVHEELMIDLLAPFQSLEGAKGPDLARPGKGLRIVPGKLSGEPHIEGTRIETRVLWALRKRGFELEEIVELYADLKPDDVRNALILEDQLHKNLQAA